MQPTMRRIKGDGIELELAEWPGQGRPVLCVHGLTGNCRVWDVIAAGLAPRHRVLAPDLRGRGLSGNPRSGYTLESHVRDLELVLEEAGLNRAAVMGHSLGAVIALLMAAEHPFRVERLILVDGAGKLSKLQMAKVFAGIKPSLDRLGKTFPSFSGYVGQMKQAPFLQPWNPAMDAYYRHEVETVAEGVRSRVSPLRIRHESDHLRKLDVSRYYPRVRCPVLILRAPRGMLAEDDVLLPGHAAARMLEQLRDVRLVDVEGANHYSILFQPHPVRDAAIRAFLEAP